LRRLLDLAVLRFRSEREKEIEMLVLGELGLRGELLVEPMLLFS
jgi:hypothetical protein